MHTEEAPIQDLDEDVHTCINIYKHT